MEYKNVFSIDDKELFDSLMYLHESIFKDSSTLVRKMENKPKLLITLAIDESKVVGYKMGYELDSDVFYSWLGGVDTKYRNKGIGSKLMEIQHQYLIESGYKAVRTKTMNKWREMLILNIKNGFDVIDTSANEAGEIKIILEKKLLR